MINSLGQRSFTLPETRNLVDQYAVIYGLFKPLVNFEAERIFPPGQNQTAYALSPMYARGLLSHSEEFRRTIPLNLAAIVDDSLSMMERIAMSALQQEMKQSEEPKNYGGSSTLVADIRKLAEQYAELKYTYDQLLAIRDEERDTMTERKMAAEFGATMRQFKRYTPEYLQRVVADSLKEMKDKLLKVSLRTRRAKLEIV